VDHRWSGLHNRVLSNFGINFYRQSLSVKNITVKISTNICPRKTRIIFFSFSNILTCFQEVIRNGFLDHRSHKAIKTLRNHRSCAGHRHFENPFLPTSSHGNKVARAISPSLQNLYQCPNLSKKAWEQAHVFLPLSVAQSCQILFAVVENDIENSC